MTPVHCIHHYDGSARGLHGVCTGSLFTIFGPPVYIYAIADLSFRSADYCMIKTSKRDNNRVIAFE
jgi:hypothetical protein